MRLTLGTSILLGLSLFGCKSESDPPVYLDAAYQLRCIDCQPRTADDPQREVKLLDGEEGWTITCSVSPVGGKPAVTFNASYRGERSSESYGLRVTRAPIGGDPSDACLVRVVEGANTYEGKCTADDPDDQRPCKVDFEQDGNIVEGRVYCDRIPNNVNLSSFRYLVDPGSRDDSAKLQIHNCEGL
jgi:hypothetical protein